MLIKNHFHFSRGNRTFQVCMIPILINGVGYEVSSSPRSKTTVALFTLRCAIFSKALTFYIQREENNQSLKKEMGRKLRADN